MSHNICLYCCQLLTTSIQKKFCSNSCSAKYNNQRRTPESRLKQQASLSKTLNERKVTSKVFLCECKVCNKIFYYKNRIKTCSPECRSTIYSKTAKNNPYMGGNKNTRAKGYYTSPFAGEVWLESSYELRVAQDLDANYISWKRPEYLIWFDQRGQERKYFPDFYLPEYDVYLDPKNSYLIEQDEYKIESVRKTHNVNILVLDANHLSWDKIKHLLHR